MKLFITVKLKDNADGTEVGLLAETLRKGVIDNLDGIEPPEVPCDKDNGYEFMVKWRVSNE